MVNITAKHKGMIGFILFVFGLALGMVFTQAAYAEREVIRGAAGGALKGAAIGELSDGDSGKAAAWGAAAGAARGVANKRRAEQQALAAEEKARQDAYIRELELKQAYEKGKQEAAGVSNASAYGKAAR